MNNNNKLDYSLDTNEIQILNPDALILIYTELNKIFDIQDLFKKTNKVIILYLLQDSHTGHWVCLFKRDNNEINLSFTFDIYYVWDYFYHLRHFNFKIDCNDDLKPYFENFIENNYFDKSVFDDYP